MTTDRFLIPSVLGCMRTNDALLEEARRLSGRRTKREIIEEAPRTYTVG